MKNALQSTEKFLETQNVEAELISAKFDRDKNKRKIVRLDFEIGMDALKDLPQSVGDALASMVAQPGLLEIKFGVEFPDRLVELYLPGKSRRPEIVIDKTTLQRLRLTRPKPGAAVTLEISCFGPADDIGHWIVDHYGETVRLHAIKMQLELPANE